MHEREQDIFRDALAIEGDDARRAYLESACAGDDALRRRIEILLHAHEGAREFLERPLLDGLGPADAAGTLGPTRLADGPTRGADADDADDEGDPLDFLTPAGRADSRGRLAHYEVLEVLGRGGFGTVVRAFDEKLHRMVAIKVMARALAATSPPRKRFLREARAAAAVRHPHVVAIHAVDEAPVPYLVMEYVAGPTLQAKLDRSGPMEPAEVVRIGLQVAEGLAAAHRQGLVHRDIKPANILLEDAAERVKITDFGLARAADDASLTQSGVIAGTPLYMAPEQAQGEAIDARSDLFSLGSVLYVMCTGRPPFRAASTVAVLRRVAEDDARPIREIIPEVPPALCELIDRLHAKDPADRPSSADAVAARLRALRDDLRGATTRRRPAPAPDRPRPVVSAALDSEFRPRPAPKDQRPRRPRCWFAPNEARTWIVLGLILATLVALRLAERDGLIHFRNGMVRLGDGTGTLTVHINEPDAQIIVTDLGPNPRPPAQMTTSAGAVRLFRLEPGQYSVSARVRRGDRSVATSQETVTIVADGNRSVYLASPPYPFAPEPPAPPRPPMPPVVVDAWPPSAAGADLLAWGRLTDPVGDVQPFVWRDGLRLTLPTGPIRDLNSSDEPDKNLDAPRALRAVTGDFSAVVRLPAAARAKPGPPARAYQSRALVVWASPRDYLRFAVSSNGSDGEAGFVSDLALFRTNHAEEYASQSLSDGPAWLRAERRGNRLYLARSGDGRSWSPFRVVDLAGMPATLEVGVAALNTTDGAFVAEFEGLALRSGPRAALPVGFGFDLPASTPDLGPWGRFFDPLGGTRADRDGGLLVLNLPSQAPRDLNPEPGISVDAPRTLRAVEGDFQFRVTVQPFGPPRPGSSVNGSGNTFHWAGPIVWADEFNFARFGVGRSTVVDGGNATLNEEFFRDGRGRVYDSRPVESDRPVHFLLERRGATLRLASSLDGQTWTDAKPVALGGLPSRLYVGVAAVNTGLAPFTAPFDGWSLRAGGATTLADAPPPGADLGPWGRLVDPVGDVRPVKFGDLLTLDLPGGRVRDLNSTAEFGRNLDAPRALGTVRGDFSAVVRLPSTPRSGPGPDGRTYHFRGLLIWNGPGDFLRFGVSSNGHMNGGPPLYDLGFFRDGRDVDGGTRPADEGPTYLRAERRGHRLYLSRSGDGQVWFPYKVCNLGGMPATVQVGVTALSTTAEAFAADFGEWSLRTADAGPPGLAYAVPASAPEVGAWGRLVDPLRATKVEREGGRLALDLPDDRPCDLNPNNPDSVNGPRVLRPVDGDFRLQVTLPAFSKPDEDSYVRGRDRCYRWAGPIVWADEFNFVRFGVGRNANGDGVSLNLEQFRHMKGVVFRARWVEDRPIRVRLERRGKALRVAASQDGQDWVPAQECDLSGLPDRLFVGVGAVNTSTDDFEAEFEDWSLEPLGPAAPTPAPAAAAAGPDLGAFGRLVDPLGRVEARPLPHGLALRLPERAPCDLNPAAGLAMNAPRTLRPVEGDFRWRVRVAPVGRPDPGTGPGGDDRAYRWAGPVVWLDEANFVRFGVGRNASEHDGRPLTSLEVFRDAATLDAGLWFYEDAPIHLEVERRGPTFTFRTSPDGQAWADHKTLDLPALPRRLQVGVAAVNTGTQEFAPTFEDWFLESHAPAGP